MNIYLSPLPNLNNQRFERLTLQLATHTLPSIRRASRRGDGRREMAGERQHAHDHDKFTGLHPLNLAGCRGIPPGQARPAT